MALGNALETVYSILVSLRDNDPESRLNNITQILAGISQSLDNNLLENKLPPGIPLEESEYKFITFK